MTWHHSYDSILIRFHAAGQNDFEITRNMLDLACPVAQTDVTAARRRLGLTRHPKRRDLPVASVPAQNDNRPAQREKPNPLRLAGIWLGGRLRETPDGFRLDGVPASLQAVMRATNAAMKAANFDQVGPDHWRV
jgi:hypothetical protein